MKYLVELFKARAQAKKTSAESTVLLMNSATGYSDGLAKRVDAISEAFDEFRKQQNIRNQEQLARDRADDRLKLAHSRWDDKVVAVIRDLGGKIENPPPLYPPEGNVQ
jgi:hypothetical protein